MIEKDIFIIDRDAVIITSKKPLIDWVNYYRAELKLEVPSVWDHDKSRIYLIPELRGPKDSLEYLKANFDHFFRCELLGWFTEEELMPKKRTWKLFNEWFSFSIQSMVLDVDEFEIEREEYCF